MTSSPTRSDRAESATRQDGDDARAWPLEWSSRLVPSLRDLVRISRRPELHGAVRGVAGVHVPEHVVLALARIGDAAPVRLSDLAEQMDMGRTTLSRQVSELISLGLVERTPDPDDGRAATLQLTPAGEDARHRIRDAWGEMLAEVASSWSDCERELFVRLLIELTRGLTDVVGRRHEK